MRWVVKKRDTSHTPNSQEMLKRYEAFPILIAGLILLIRPGRVGAMDSSSATAALQFWERISSGPSGPWMDGTITKDNNIQFHSSIYICLSDHTWQGHQPFHDGQPKTTKKSEKRASNCLQTYISNHTRNHKLMSTPGVTTHKRTFQQKGLKTQYTQRRMIRSLEQMLESPKDKVPIHQSQRK